jgi:1,2-phenylacetyl-CoA epoxidase catalytic subunit
MDGQEFATKMNDLLWQILGARDIALSRIGESAEKTDMAMLLRGALRNELEASEIAALWVASTPEIEAKLAFAQQAGDEARHYQLISCRLAELGETTDFNLTATGYSKLFNYLESLPTTVERVAAAQFTREAIGYKANELFIVFCEAAGDPATAELYRRSIQPDEQRHHEWGKELLAGLAQTEPEQQLANEAILKTLELAEELRSLAAGRLLVETLPGC